MKVASWNVNSINARLERVLLFLKRETPDIVCLQELKCEETRFPKAPLEELGYHCVAFGQKAYNGVAILSRAPFFGKAQKGFNDGIADPSARFLSVKIKDVTVMSVYIPNGQEVGSEKYAYKLEWMKRLGAFLKNHCVVSEKILIAGDFNVAPEDRDVHDPEFWRGKILFSDPEKEALRGICQFGLKDTFRLFEKEGGHYSWWDYRELAFPFNKGLRIDFILANGSLASHCVSASILRAERKGKGSSDHAPVMAEFGV